MKTDRGLRSRLHQYQLIVEFYQRDENSTVLTRKRNPVKVQITKLLIQSKTLRDYLITFYLKFVSENLDEINSMRKISKTYIFGNTHLATCVLEE